MEYHHRQSRNSSTASSLQLKGKCEVTRQNLRTQDSGKKGVQIFMEKKSRLVVEMNQTFTQNG